MEGNKPWWASRGVIGAITATVSAAVVLGGTLLGLEPTDYRVAGAVAMVGSVMAFWGRLAATETIIRKKESGDEGSTD